MTNPTVTHIRAGGSVEHPGPAASCPKCHRPCIRTGPHGSHGSCPGVDFPAPALPGFPATQLQREIRDLTPAQQAYLLRWLTAHRPSVVRDALRQVRREIGGAR